MLWKEGKESEITKKRKEERDNEGRQLGRPMVLTSKCRGRKREGEYHRITLYSQTNPSERQKGGAYHP